MHEQMLTTHEARLATLAARLMALAVRTAQAGSHPANAADTERLHEEGRLYPQLSITLPHGGGAVRLELTLHDPSTDAAVVSMLTLEAQAEELMPCH